MGTTSSRRTALLIVTFLILGAVVAVIGPGTFSLTSNLCLESADEVRIENSVIEFSGDKGWSINAAAGCDNKIVGGTTTLPKDSINTNEASAERDFTLGLTSFEAWFYQGIQDTRTPVFNVRPAVFSDCGFFSGDDCPNAQDDCDAFQAESAETSPAETRYTDGNDLYCYKVERVGAVSDWQLAQGTDFDGTFTASAAGRSDSDTISKDDVTAQLRVGDVNGDSDTEHAHVTWTGSLAGELRSIDLDGFRPTCSNDCENQETAQISWGVGEESRFTSYRSYDRGGFEHCVQNEVDNGGDPSTCVNSYNNRAGNVFLSAEKGIKNLAGFDVQDVRTRNGEIQVVADRGTAIDRPEFRILVDADWIGFSIPTVEPRFVDVPAVTVVGNSQSTAAIDVKNTGETGEMQVFADCPAPISGGSDTAMVPAGETGRFFLPISAGATETREYTCTVTAQDTDTAETARTAQLTVHAKTSCPDGDGDGVCDQLDACPQEPGAGSNNGCPLEEECGNEIDDDGDGRVDEGCDGSGGDDGFFTGLFQGFGDVGERIGTGIDNVVTDLQNSISGLLNPLQNAWLAAKALATLVGAVVGFNLGRSLVRDIESRRVRRGTALLVAALVAILVYSLFSSILFWVLIAVVLAVAAYVVGPAALLRFAVQGAAATR